jgi:hypothetical protein
VGEGTIDMWDFTSDIFQPSGEGIADVYLALQINDVLSGVFLDLHRMECFPTIVERCITLIFVWSEC